MKQKLAVINALLFKPALLLLDEPTAGVDVMARAEIWAMLERERSAALIIMSTSYLDEAEQLRPPGVSRRRPRRRHRHAGGAARRRVPLELYRAWGDDPRGIARAARQLPYVDGARATGRFARVEVRRRRTPGAARVVRDLQQLAGAGVRFAEPRPLDMESALLALARGVVA